MPKITLPMVLELIEAQEWGPSAPKMPYTAAKERLAHITAAKAVALALTPGLDPIKVRNGKGVEVLSKRCGRVLGVRCAAVGGTEWQLRVNRLYERPAVRPTRALRRCSVCLNPVAPACL